MIGALVLSFPSALTGCHQMTSTGGFVSIISLCLRPQGINKIMNFLPRNGCRFHGSKCNAGKCGFPSLSALLLSASVLKIGFWCPEWPGPTKSLPLTTSGSNYQTSCVIPAGLMMGGVLVPTNRPVYPFLPFMVNTNVAQLFGTDPRQLPQSYAA